MILKNKIALVTGSGQGIGKAIAILFAKKGAKVIVNDIERKKTKGVVENINKDFINDKRNYAIEYIADVSSANEVKELFTFITKNFNGLDILVNNAAISPKQKFEKISYEDWGKVIDVNLTGPFICIQEAYKIMKRKKYGKIVNISSFAGINGGILASAHYVASKAGLIGLTKYMAKIGAPYHINTNVIAPGRVKTDKYYLYSKEFNKKVDKNILLDSAAEPEDIAEAALFLASNKSNHITGICMNVTGGILL